MNKNRPSTSRLTLFGYPLASPIGIAACALTTGNQIPVLAQLGFDVITHKTVRAYYSPAWPAPNQYFVQCTKQLTKQDIHQTFYASAEPTLCLTNSYGNNSPNPETVLEQLQKARLSLQDGQVLIVSVYGKGLSPQEQIADFVAAAQLAQQGGAMVVEANLSCPNLYNEQLLYQDPVLVEQVCSAISQAITIPLTIKIGICATNELLKNILLAAHTGGARGVCGINTVPVKVVNEHGQPIFGQEREVSGLSGAPLFNLTLDFVRAAREIITQEQLPLTLFATGGVIKPEQFNRLLAAGADIVQTATGAIINQQLAQEYHAMNNTLCSPEKQQLIKQLHAIGAIQIKNVQLKSGVMSPIYFDMRLVMSYPKLLAEIARQLAIMTAKTTYELICGVPHAAVPLATAISLATDRPLIMQRKEAKAHGNKKMIEGAYHPGSTCLVIEDVMTTGSSIMECIKLLEQDGGLIINDIAIVIDREQSGVSYVTNNGYKVHALITMSDILQVLLNQQLITHQQYATIKEFCAQHATSNPSIETAPTQSPTQSSL